MQNTQEDKKDQFSTLTTSIAFIKHLQDVHITHCTHNLKNIDDYFLAAEKCKSKWTTISPTISDVLHGSWIPFMDSTSRVSYEARIPLWWGKGKNNHTQNLETYIELLWTWEDLSLSLSYNLSTIPLIMIQESFIGQACFMRTWHPGKLHYWNLFFGEIPQRIIIVSL